MTIRPWMIAAALVLLPVMVRADDGLPQFPKVGPPEPLPEAQCDTAAASDGGWILGRWVAPRTRWEFTRTAQGALVWTMDRQGGIGSNFGWQDGARIDGTVSGITGCTVTLDAGQGAFAFQGVVIDGGKLFGFATNTKGDHVRFLLRRER